MALVVTCPIAEFDDWRGKIADRLRNVFVHVAPDIVEDWQWVRRQRRRRIGS